MSKLMFVFSVFLFSCFGAFAQNQNDISKIEQVVRQFSEAGDQQNVKSLDKLLHPQYRSVVHRLFGEKDASLLDKSLYLQLMKDKKMGGDSREVHVLSLDIYNNIATVKAVLQGKALRFITFLSLVKMENGEWLIIEDMPDIAKA